MKREIEAFTIVVDDYDKAIDFYVNKLGFVLIEDTKLSDSKRWVTIATSNNSMVKILLAKASNGVQLSRVGHQTGGRVGFFLSTNNFWQTYNEYCANGVVFQRKPVMQPYGTVAVFQDLYGNLWDLIQYRG